MAKGDYDKYEGFYLEDDDTKISIKYGNVDENFSKLLEELENNSKIKAVNLSCSFMGDSKLEKLVEVLQKKSCIEKLDLSVCDITSLGISNLTEGVKSNNITHLDLSANSNFGDEGAIEIAELLLVSTSLRTLKLYGCEIGAKGAEAIAESLKENKTLLKLHLGSNYIKKEGALAIAEALSYNTVLESLNIDCFMGDKGLQLFFSRLWKNKALTYLSCDSSIIEDDTAKVFADILPLTNIQVLRFSSFFVSREILKEIDSALLNNKFGVPKCIVSDEFAGLYFCEEPGKEGVYENSEIELIGENNFS